MEENTHPLTENNNVWLENTENNDVLLYVWNGKVNSKVKATRYVFINLGIKLKRKVFVVLIVCMTLWNKKTKLLYAFI